MGLLDGILNKLGSTAQNAINSASVKVKSEINNGINDAVKGVK